MQKIIEARRRPKKDEAAKYYHGYLNAVDQDDLMEALMASRDSLSLVMDNLPEGKLKHRYADGKWSIAEILVHLADSERVFSYRALRISRADKTPLAGYEQDDYVPFSAANERSLDSLAKELLSLRDSTIDLFENLNADQLVRRGIASGNEVSTRALGFLIAGHQQHHLRIMEERYLNHK